MLTIFKKRNNGFVKFNHLVKLLFEWKHSLINLLNRKEFEPIANKKSRIQTMKTAHVPLGYVRFQNSPHKITLKLKDQFNWYK